MSKYYNSVAIVADSSEKFKIPSDVVLGARMSNNESIRREIVASSAPDQGKAGVIRFNYTFPDGNVSSVPLIQADLTMRITGTQGLATVNELYGALGLRQFALNRHFTNARVEMNGHEMTSRPAQTVECLVNSQSLSQLMMLSDAPAGNLMTSYNNTYINSSLRSGANTIDTVSSNGLGNSWDIISITQPNNGADPPVFTANDFTIVLRYTEAVIAQPFQYQERNPVPFRNLRDFKLDLDMTSIVETVGDFLAVNTTNGTENMTVSIPEEGASFKLLVHTWNPSLSLDIPKTIVWNSPEVTQLASASLSLTKAGGKQQMKSGSFVLNSVPTAIFVYAKRARPTDGTCYG